MQNNLWLHDKGKSDLVIFNVRDILRSVTLEKIQQIHKYPSPRQRMAFLTHESIDNETDLKNRLSWSEGFFNWTVTYKRESDIFYSYGSYVPLPSAERPAKIPDYAAEKNQSVLWAVSNRGRARDKYVKNFWNSLKLIYMATVRKNLAKTITARNKAISTIFSAHIDFIWHLKTACVLITLLRNFGVHLVEIQCL